MPASLNQADRLVNKGGKRLTEEQTLRYNVSAQWHLRDAEEHRRTIPKSLRLTGVRG